MRYRVEEIRKEQNMTQSELAQASGISRATVAALESGKEIVVKSSTLQAIANALKCKVPDLFAQNV
ncbi:MAG: helix-turn-helix transcriptional regulator [Acidaminococcaceae bacterium]|nr:helix-turn-helix transcriptional regulator [Acidaminococcaceae bacterium]